MTPDLLHIYQDYHIKNKVFRIISDNGDNFVKDFKEKGKSLADIDCLGEHK